MIVKFKANQKPYTGWLIKDKLYVVLGISFDCDEHSPTITIKTEDADIPAIFNLDEFEIIDPSISPNWVMTVHSPTRYSIRPKAFVGDFWGDFHDADPHAEEIFWKVYKELEKELALFL